MNPVSYILRLLGIIILTLFSLRILFVLVQRVPGVVVALSLITLLFFGIAYYKGGFHTLGISKKISVIVIIGASILLIISTAILINLG